MKNKKVLSISLGVVSVFIIGIVVAYAALSTTLNAKFNSVTAGDIRWDVGFNVDNSGTIAGALSRYDQASDSRDKCGDAHVTNTGVTFESINLTSNSDCQYIIPVTNKGNIEARLSSVTALKPNNTSCTTTNNNASMTCGNITYLIDNLKSDYLDLTNSLLPSGTTKNIWIKVVYDGHASTPVAQEGAGFTFNFTQS